MIITDIEVINLHFEYPADKRFSYAGGTCTGRLTSLVRVYTDSGLVGLGSVYSHPGLVRSIIEDQLRPLLIGEDPLEIDKLWERCYGITRWYGRKGVAVSALGGIDIALWDIRGKAAGKPVFELLGAKRTRVPAYASGLLWKDSVEELQREAERHLANGFRAMKMRLGKDHGYDRAALVAVRKAVGPDVPLMIDGNARYSLDQARGFVDDLKRAGVFWLEEPFLPENPDDFVALRPDLGDIPLAAGENEFGPQGFNELINGGIVQIVQPDCCRCGGLTAALRVAEAAREHGLRVAPHTWSDAVALAANMHFVASQPHAITVEMDQTGNPFIDDLLAEPLTVKEGEIELLLAPGLGIELNADVVKQYTLSPVDPIPAGNYSDMVFGGESYSPAAPY